jgi:hypothetical protein
MFEEEVLAGLRLAPHLSEASSAVRVQLRLPWYRSLPLACIERLDLTIDGTARAADSLTIVINGARHPLPDVGRRHDVWWFVLDAIDVELGASPSLSPGDHRISVALALQIPYGDPDFRPQLNIKQLAECTNELRLAGRDE